MIPISIDPKAIISDWSAPAHILARAPKTGAANVYSDRTGQFHAGIWESTPGKWKVTYREEEFCLLLQGRVALVAENGDKVEYKIGDAFVIPSGFQGTWETLETVRKYYVIFEPKAE